MLIVSGDIPSSSCSSSVFIESLVHGLQDLRVSAHAKIVVGAPDSNSLILVGHVSARKLFGKTINVVEVAVGLVSVLLVELSSVESLVVELGGFVLGWTSRLDMLRIRDC